MARRKTVAYYLKQIERKAQSKDCVYRGQANAEWPLRSGAERRMRKALKEPIDEISSDSIKSYHDDLLDKARERGFGRVDGSDLNDLELLAALQHFGAATCLIDFTKQALVALYFACRAENKKDGKIFIVPDKTISPPQKKEKKSISKLLESNQSLLWRPMLHGAAERRIMTQSALLLINITEKHEDMQDVIIIEEDKKEILEELDSTYQISADTLFMDLSGFAQNNAADKAFSDHLTYIYDGLRKLRNENPEVAIKDFDEAIQLKPDYAAAYLWRGLAKYGLGMYEKAVKHKLEQYKEAIKDFNEAIRLEPDDAAAYWGRGMAKYDLQQHEEAIKDFDEAIRLGADDAVVYWWRGRAKYDLGVYGKAVKHQLKQYKEAIKDCNEAIRLKPDYAAAYEWRGLAKYTLKQHEEAIKDFDEAIRLDPSAGSAYLWRGTVWSELGDEDKASSDIQNAFKVGGEQGKQELADKISVELKKFDS